MDKTMYDFKKEAAKRKVKGFFEGVKKKTDQAVAWGMEHPAEAVAIVGMTIGGVKKVSSLAQTAMEERRREVEFWDARLGMYSKSKRPLTKEERQELIYRYKVKEEPYEKILYDMKLLRRR